MIGPRIAHPQSPTTNPKPLYPIPRLYFKPEEAVNVAGEKSNPKLERLIKYLRLASHEHKAPIWKDLALRLSRPRRHTAQVNVSRLNRVGAEGETLVVPGKVLGSGTLTKPLNVVAFGASKEARSKIENAGGRLMDIDELVAENPRGSFVRIVE